MKQKHSRAKGTSSDRNPLYVKIGKRIRQARLMAKESNSRILSERLGWSGGRLNNFETGASTPGVEETLQYCEAVGADPCWITYGVGSPRASTLQSTRYRNLMAVVDKAESAGNLLELLEGIQVTVDGLDKLRANPFKEIPDRLARRCEKHLQLRKGWFDESHIEHGFCQPLPDDMRQLLTLYTKLSANDRRKLYAMGALLLGD
ncbi:MAG: helix-turn-helix transcriptional regulator [Candidatus Thiodiazotropha sp.]